MAENYLPYNSFNRFLLEKYGTVVRRLSVDLGRGCPHRLKNPPGCFFCNDDAICPAYLDPQASLEDQLKSGTVKFPKAKFMAYLQAGANTEGTIEELKKIYRFCLSYPNVVGLIISTRPDYLPPDIFNLLAAINQQTFLVVELGLQTTHNSTLQKINRGHDFECFAKASADLQKHHIYQAAHLILGLPDETPEMMIQSAKKCVECGVQALKIHHLQILRHTPLADLWEKGQIKLLTEDDYPGLICDILENIPWDIHIMRLLTNTNDRQRLAPNWTKNKDQILTAIRDEFARRGTTQGFRLK